MSSDANYFSLGSPCSSAKPEPKEDPQAPGIIELQSDSEQSFSQREAQDYQEQCQDPEIGDEDESEGKVQQIHSSYKSQGSASDGHKSNSSSDKLGMSQRLEHHMDSI
jgi:hypothetical protein